ncbi:MAG: dCMP deaminase family protein [Clostridia bacterium]|nr:dCMP deaminase family protein [Clostridia bacterium]
MVKKDSNQAKWDKRFVDMTKLVAGWSSCLRRQVGAVIVKDKRVLGVGYNGAPAGVKSCVERNECIRDQQGIQSGTHRELCYAVCAEQNAILEAGKSRCDMRGSTMYCSLTPCSACAKLIINAGIVRIVCLDNYPDKFSLKLLKEAGVVVEYYT